MREKSCAERFRARMLLVPDPCAGVFRRPVDPRVVPEGRRDDFEGSDLGGCEEIFPDKFSEGRKERLPRFADLSPRAAASNAVLPVTSSGDAASFHRRLAGSFSIAFAVSRLSAVAEA